MGGILPLEKFLRTAATLLVPEKIGERKLSLAIELTDRKEAALVTVGNAVLVGQVMGTPGPADARLRGSMRQIMDLSIKRATLEDLEKAGLQVTGDRRAVTELLAGTELPQRHFPVVAPTRIDLSAVGK